MYLHSSWFPRSFPSFVRASFYAIIRQLSLALYYNSTSFPLSSPLTRVHQSSVPLVFDHVPFITPFTLCVFQSPCRSSRSSTSRRPFWYRNIFDVSFFRPPNEILNRVINYALLVHYKLSWNFCKGTRSNLVIADIVITLVNLFQIRFFVHRMKVKVKFLTFFIY